MKRKPLRTADETDLNGSDSKFVTRHLPAAPTRHVVAERRWKSRPRRAENRDLSKRGRFFTTEDTEITKSRWNLIRKTGKVGQDLQNSSESPMPNQIFVGIMSILLILSRFNPAGHLSPLTGHLLSTHDENAQSHVLLRSGGDRASRRTFGDGLLPLRSLPALFRRAGQRIHVVEDRQCGSHQRRRRPGKIQTKRNERSQVLHKVRRPYHG